MLGDRTFNNLEAAKEGVDEVIRSIWNLEDGGGREKFYKLNLHFPSAEEAEWT